MTNPRLHLVLPRSTKLIATFNTFLVQQSSLLQLLHAILFNSTLRTATTYFSVSLHFFQSGSVCNSFLLVLPFSYLSLNFHVWRHIGHCWLACELSHFTMQCMWKQCEQEPQTSGQSSPGSEQSGQQPSKAIRQIPQLSSLASHFHTATPIQLFTVTFILDDYHTHDTFNE